MGEPVEFIGRKQCSTVHTKHVRSCWVECSGGRQEMLSFILQYELVYVE